MEQLVKEAGSQGLMAGINAVLKIKNKDPFILKRRSLYWCFN